MYNPNSLGCSGTTAAPSTVGINCWGDPCPSVETELGVIWAGQDTPTPTAHCWESQENSLEGGAWALAAGAVPELVLDSAKLGPQSSPCSWAHPCRGSLQPSLTPALAQTRSHVDHLKIQQGHKVPRGTHRIQALGGGN